MERIFDIVLSSFDFGYTLSVNILTYLCIKFIDSVNGDRKVPTWAKRLMAVVCGCILAGIIMATQGYNNVIMYSFILSLVSWDVIFKPLLKYFKNLDYNDNRKLREPDSEG